MTTDEKFNQIYQKILHENADEMEIARKKAKSEEIHNIIIIIMIMLIILVISYLMARLKTNFPIELIATIIFLAILIYIVMKNRGEKSKIEQYKMDFKTKIVGTMIKSFEEQLELKPKEGLSPAVFKEAEFENFDVYHSEDLIQGTLKNNCKFAMSEVLIEQKNSDDENLITLFNGLFAKMETPKPFNTVLYLRNDRNDKNLYDKIFGSKLKFDKLRIQLDSQEFEKIFDVYASNHIIAMQLLTADIMQDLIQFHKEMKMNYELTIKENCMYIRFWCGKMFEPAKIEKFSLDKDTLYKYYKMLDFTFSLTNKMLKLLNDTQYN